MQAAVGLAVIKYSHGSTVFQHVVREMGCIESSSTAAGLAKADDEHMYFARESIQVRRRKVGSIEGGKGRAWKKMQ